MDKFTRQMLEQTGLLGMVGKAERGPAAIDAIREYRSRLPHGRRRSSLPRLQGHPQLASSSAFDDLGMEAIYEFDVVDMPVTVAVDSKGTSVHNTGPAEWKARIAGDFAGVPILQ